jgi:hypothetical protein
LKEARDRLRFPVSISRADVGGTGWLPASSSWGSGRRPISKAAGRSISTRAITRPARKPDSPVYTFLSHLSAPIENAAALADQALESAYSLAPKDWMRDSTQKQIESLKGLLQQSPIKRLET